jgi:MFS family permease
MPCSIGTLGLDSGTSRARDIGSDRFTAIVERLFAVSKGAERFVAVTAAPPDSGTGASPPSRIRKFLPNGLKRSYVLLVAGSSVSMFGTRVSAIAYPMLVLFLTRSPIIAGWAAFAATAPSVLAYIPAGALIDRWDARKAMLASECGRGGAVVTIVIALAMGHTGEWLVALLIGIAVLEETLEVFSGLSERRLIAGLLGRDEATSVLGGNEARTQMMIFTGRPAGGLLFGIAHICPFAVDAFSFLCSIASLVNVKYQKSDDELWIDECDHKYSAKNLLKGLQWVWYDRFARLACLLNAGATLVAQALILIFLAEAERRKLSFLTIGIVLASTGAGGAMGSLAAKRLRRLYRGQWLRIQMWLWLIVFLGVSITITIHHHSLRYLIVEMFFLGLSGAIGNVEIDKYLIERSPSQMLARVASVNSLADFCAYAVGPVLGGLLVQLTTPVVAILVLTSIVLVLAVCSVWMPSAQQSDSGQVQCEPDLASAHG